VFTPLASWAIRALFACGWSRAIGAVVTGAITASRLGTRCTAARRAGMQGLSARSRFARYALVVACGAGGPRDGFRARLEGLKGFPGLGLGLALDAGPLGSRVDWPRVGRDTIAGLALAVGAWSRC
jgi:hypothetical protein